MAVSRHTSRVPAVVRGASSRPPAPLARTRAGAGHLIRQDDGGGDRGGTARSRGRLAVERWLSGRVTARLYDDVRLVVSELVTNSVRHAQLTRDMTIRISVALVDGAVASRSRIL